MAQVLEINQISHLKNYEFCWDSQFKKTPNASFFQTLAWLETYWKHYGQDKQLRVLIVRAQQEVIGIVPLVQQTESTKAGAIQVLTYPLDNWGAFFSPLGSDTAATLYAAFQFLQSKRAKHDLLDMRWIDPTVDRGRVATAMRCHGLHPNILPWNSTYQIELPNTFDEYLSGRSPKFRANIRRSIRQAESQDIEFQRYRPVRGDNENPGLIEECIDFSRNTWQGESTTGTTLCHSKTVDYFRDCYQKASKLGMIDIVTLRAEEAIIAFCYNFHYKGQVLGIRSGFDPAFRKISLGNVLLSLQIRDSIQRGDVSIDLGTHHSDVKTRWTTNEKPALRICHYQSYSPRAQLLKLGHWLKKHHQQNSSKSTN